MEKSKGIIVIAVGLIAVLIVWKIGFSPSSQTENQNNKDAENSRRTIDSPNQPATQPGRIAGNTRASTRDNMAGAGVRGDRAQTPDRNAGRNNPAYTMESTGLKIAIPKDVNEAVLQVLYNEYLKINPMGSFMGRTRGGRGGNQNGMDRGAMQGRMGGRGGMGGGMDMSAFQGMDFGGMMNMGGMDMGAMQDAMMNMGGGFPGGGMDMGAPMGGPDMGAPQEETTDMD